VYVCERVGVCVCERVCALVCERVCERVCVTRTETVYAHPFRIHIIWTRRIYPRGFTGFSREGIFGLGSLPLLGNSKFYFRVKSLPGVSPKHPFIPILDSTEGIKNQMIRV